MWLAWRRPVIVASHAGLFLVSYRLAFELRFDFDIPGPFDEWRYLAWAVPLIVLRLGAYSWYGMFHGMWKYTGQRDLESLAKATLGSTLAFALVVLAVGPSFPRSVFLVEWMIALGLAAGLRLGVRSFASAARRIESDATARRLLVIGAGDAGEMLLREIHRNTHAGATSPWASSTTTPPSSAMHIHGVPVLGPVERVADIVSEHGVDGGRDRDPLGDGQGDAAHRRALVPRSGAVRTIPGVESLIDGRVTSQPDPRGRHRRPPRARARDARLADHRRASTGAW
jgi:FlaA1/EpsC-like NDP-sugar epimerase